MIKSFFVAAAVLGSALGFAACGASARDCSNPDLLMADPENCGACGNVCQQGQACTAGTCVDAPCEPGKVATCYSSSLATRGIGECHDGKRTCAADKTWGPCLDEVVPRAEVCGSGKDENCNGAVDEDQDLDGDGFSTCQGDCCDSVECSKPGLVNPGSFDVAGNRLDDDCDGTVDNTQVTCDAGLASDSNNAMDFAKAIDLCQTATDRDRKWGVISAKFTRADGSQLPQDKQHAIRARFGTNGAPKAGASLAVLSTGAAATPNDSKPSYVEFDNRFAGLASTSGFPADFLAANAGKLPNAPGCPEPDSDEANDPIMLTLKVRAPTNAQSFKLAVNFFSSEFPEFTCSRFNDFFAVLLDSGYSGMPANPADKKLAFYESMSGTKFPVGVNLAYSQGGQGTGLFTQCINGETGCSSSVSGTISSCAGVELLAGTGFDTARPGSCGDNSQMGGATGWLVTSGNVKGGETITLRIALWDTSDHILDSVAVIDNFTWSTEASDPGTVIE